MVSRGAEHGRATPADGFLNPLRLPSRMRSRSIVFGLGQAGSLLLILIGVLIIAFPNILEYAVAVVLIATGLLGLLRPPRYMWR